MSKVPKAQAKKHREAMTLVRSGRALSLDEREFVLEHFHEGAEHMNSLAGAFFTPDGLARDFSLEVGPVGPGRVLDLCAGIGKLAIACSERIAARYEKPTSFVCVELNEAYVEVGRAVFPEATWVCASAFDVEAFRALGPFDWVISNPPFGRVPAPGFEGRYTGGDFELRLIELASHLAPMGTFIVPQMSAPFRYSGAPCFEKVTDGKAARFTEQTGIELEANCGIDTTSYKSEWRGVAPTCEIVCCDFTEVRASRSAARPEPRATMGGQKTEPAQLALPIGGAT